MIGRLLVTVLTLLSIAVLAPVASAGQRPAWTPPRTPDGKPDIQGTFTFSTITPLQRPDALAGKDTLGAEEAAEFEVSENKRLNRDLFDPVKGAPSAGYAPRAQGGVLSYNEFWYERGSKLTRDKRTSLVVDPPDGRIPFTDAARRGTRNGQGFRTPALPTRIRTAAWRTAASWASTPGRRCSPARTTTTCRFCRFPGMS